MVSGCNCGCGFSKKKKKNIYEKRNKKIIHYKLTGNMTRVRFVYVCV